MWTTVDGAVLDRLHSANRVACSSRMCEISQSAIVANRAHKLETVRKTRSMPAHYFGLLRNMSTDAATSNDTSDFRTIYMCGVKIRALLDSRLTVRTPQNVLPVWLRMHRSQVKSRGREVGQSRIRIVRLRCWFPNPGECSRHAETNPSSLFRRERTECGLHMTPPGAAFRKIGAVACNSPKLDKAVSCIPLMASLMFETSDSTCPRPHHRRTSTAHS